MSTIVKIVLVGSILLNIVAIWGLFQYVMYGGSPLSDIKRRLTGSYKVKSAAIPYEEDNERLKQGKLDSLRVVFYGASITRGWNLEEYFPEIHPVNRGIGTFVPDLLINYKSNVLELKPGAVVIKFCSINIKPNMPLKKLKDAMEVMVQLAKSEGIIPIVTTIIPVGKPSARFGDYSVIDTLKEFNKWVIDYSANNSVSVIDYAKAIEDDNGFLPRSCSVDPIHLNDKGYDIIAEVAKPVIYTALGLEK